MRTVNTNVYAQIDPELTDDAPALRAVIRGKLQQRKKFCESTLGKLFVDSDAYTQVINNRCAELREHVRYLNPAQLMEFQRLWRLYTLDHPHSFPSLDDLKLLARREQASRN